jgi:hypothetical protein
MPRDPKGERRPADVIGNAVHIMRVLTGEIEETIPDDGKDPAAKALGKKGGAARAVQIVGVGTAARDQQGRSFAENEYAYGLGQIGEVFGFQGSVGRAKSVVDPVSVEKIHHDRRLHREVHILRKVAFEFQRV